MIHSKSLIRCLAYVPWLLAFGLVLGWAGEAQAQIALTVDKSSVREESGATSITVTAKTTGPLATATNVVLDFGQTAPDGTIPTFGAGDKTDFGSRVGTLGEDGTTVTDGDRYLITLPTLAFGKVDAGATVTGTITFTPVEDALLGDDIDNTGENNLRIWVTGSAGTGAGVPAVTGTSFLLIDNDQYTDEIMLSVSPGEISQEAGPTEITVTATLNGETVNRKTLSFPLIVVGQLPSDPNGLPTTGSEGAPDGIQGVRDTDYTITQLGNIQINRKKVSGTAKFIVDPRSGPRWVGIGTSTRQVDGSRRPTADLRYDAVDTPDNADTTDDPDTPAIENNETLDGTDDDGDLTAQEQEVNVVPTSFTISEKKVAELKGGDGSSDGLAASPASIREEVGTQEIELTITLAAALTDPAPVNFTVTDGENAQRDINYTIEFGSLTIPADATSGKTTATLTIVDDEAGKGDRIITVNANVANSTQSTDITITDNDLLTENITLVADPKDLKEDAGLSEVTIEATIDGAVFDEDLKLTLVLGGGGTASRDVDYTATIRSLTIDAGEVSGSKTIDIIPIDDGSVDADETILVTVLEAKFGDGAAIKKADLKNDDDDTITIADATITLTDTGETDTPEDGDDTTPEFTEDDITASDTAIEGVVGEAIDDKVLPEAEGDSPLTYSVSANLPDGLSFDAATRTLSGTPTAAGDTGIVYTVIDGDEANPESAALIYTIEIVEAPEPTADVESVEFSQASVREDADTTEIMVTAVLAAPAETEETVTFSIGEGDPAAKRDTDYNMVLAPSNSAQVTIAVGGTKASTTYMLTPVSNEDDDGDKFISVTATASGAPASADIKIADDDTPSDSITLSADPHTVKENAGTVEVTITATLSGQMLEEDAVVIIRIDDASSSAKREVDYTATYSASLSISKGAISGSIPFALSPIADGEDENNQSFTLAGTPGDNIADLTVSSATITLEDTEAAPEPDPEEEEETPEPDPEPEDTTPAFSEETIAASSTAIEGTVGVALTADLPGATGDGDLTYHVSTNLPAGLSFVPSDVDESMDEDADESMDEDADESMDEESTPPSGGTISGTPTTAGKTEIVYTVIDGDKANPESAALTYTIEISPAPPLMVDVASVTPSQSSVRESDGATAITLTATLAEASTVDEKLLFTIVGPSEGTAAVRDVDYTATLGVLVPIAAGETEGSTTLTLTPINNSAVDGNKFLGVQASAASKSGASASTDIKIADDETASTSISLSVDPHSISEGAGETSGMITATLDGKALDAPTTVTIAIDGDSEATRDVDYLMLFDAHLTIEAGEIFGSGRIVIEPLPEAPAVDEGNETITVTGTADGLAGGSTTITLEDYEGMMDGEMMDLLAFAEGTMIDAIGVTAGSEMSAVVLPEASGGEGDIAYTVSELPAGLLFDAATRTLSGTTEAEGTTEVIYTATAGEESVMLTFSITVNPPLSFGNLFGLFNAGAGKANPASEHEEDGIIPPLVVGEKIEPVELPLLPGGTHPLTYSLSGLPAGLSFDQETRTVSGTPEEVGETVVILTITDAAGTTISGPIPVRVIVPPLDAPDALLAEDYKGADGAGDQGGFVLLTWDLSEHHDGIDGYRIFRELPVLGNEMVPWAMVDAVPGVDIGRAIVATLDNVATNWGIAAERGGQTTHGAAKAVFVNAENPYELMAETMTASRDAAQAGDAPVFASLLPEALAHAQGVAPKLNLVAGVLSSEITLTEEPVRATDDIAPLAVPSLIVLDAPNDAGSRILLTWTLSPSDQLLQGVIAEAFGPTALEQVVGVHGYGIYRRAASEDEFALVAQVDAGVASFVDETALNGVRYTYQVRPYDLDNETVSDIEQTAMAVRNSVLDNEGRALFGLFGADNRIGFDDFFIFADSFGLTEEDAGFDPAFDLAPNAMIDFEDFFVFADNFGRSTAGAGKRVPMLAGLNADARMYLDARTAMPIVGEDFVLDVRVADFAAIKGYGLQVQYEADKLEFVEVLTDQPLGGRELATPQVLADQAGVLTVAAHGDLVSDGEVPLSLVFRAITEIENTVVEITDNQTYDSEFGFNRLALPAPVQLQTRPEAFALANNYPNPFNPATTIKYALPQAADVELTVYNVVGQPVRTLVAEHQNAGRYVVEWDATNNNGHSLASGMYFYRLQAGGEFLEIKKMLLLK